MAAKIPGRASLNPTDDFNRPRAVCLRAEMKTECEKRKPILQPAVRISAAVAGIRGVAGLGRSFHEGDPASPKSVSLINMLSHCMRYSKIPADFAGCAQSQRGVVRIALALASTRR